jgi:hypothetical protein
MAAEPGIAEKANSRPFPGLSLTSRVIYGFVLRRNGHMKFR